MTTHSSATPHANRISRTNTIMNALKQRAQAVLNDRSIDPQSRAIIRYAMEINDPWLAELVRRADAGEEIGAPLNIEQTPETNDDDSNEEKIEALSELICRTGDEPETKTAALLVLMATVESSPQPKALANTAKNLAFIRCAELNLNGMVEAQIAVAESEMLAGT